MEEIYANIDNSKAVRSCPVPATDHTVSSSSKERVYLAVIVSLGLLSVCLLVGLIVLGVHYHGSGETAADFFAITDNLTERLQAKKRSSLTEERNQLKANLTEITKELNKLKHLSTFNKTCPAGWSNFGCSCYLLSTTSGSWDEGREDCRGRGADLVVIENAEEQTFLSKFTKGSSWIGLSDNETEGIWKWVDGTTPTLTNWVIDQPDNGNGDPRFGEEDCAELSDHNSYKWNDIKCSTSIRWICEKGPIYFAQRKYL